MEKGRGVKNAGDKNKKKIFSKKHLDTLTSIINLVSIYNN